RSKFRCRATTRWSWWYRGVNSLGHGMGTRDRGRSCSLQRSKFRCRATTRWSWWYRGVNSLGLGMGTRD
ncbi:unnamed protein product, partial [Cladocopium goreaui]